MHHSVRTGQLIYGRTKGQFNDLAKDTQDIYIEFTLRWHQYIGIGDDFDVFWHLYPSIPTTRSLAPVAPSPSPSPSPQAPQGPPRTLGLRPFEPSQPALTARFRPISPITTTVSLGLLEAFKGLQAQQVPTVPWDSALNEEQLDPLQLFKDYSRVLTDHPIYPMTDVLLTLLREFLGDPLATFQSPEQREALLTMVLNIDPSLFIVLPTGGGKTTLFLLSASLSTSEITLLVVPLVSLREDLLAKTKALGLKTTIWEQDLGDAISTYYGPQLVIISAETATSRDFLPRARALGSRIDRIIFDEAHLIYTASHYRKDFQRLRALTTLGRPLVFTTATLSPQTLNGITDRLSLLESPRVIRASINKPNLQYRVKSLPAKGSEEDHLRWTFNRLQEFFTVRRSQVICFFLYKNQVDQFAELFPDVCTPYHAGLSIEARASNLAQFTSNSKRVLAATSAIGAGFDFKNVGLITYFQGCWSLTDFVQGCGRAARASGSRGSVLVLTKANGQLPSDQRSGDLSKASHELTLFHEWVKEGICRRRLLFSTYSPWLTGTTCSGDDRLCDLCESRANSLAKQAEAAKAITLEQSKRLEALKIYISQWSNGCCIGCLVNTKSSDQEGKYISLDIYIEYLLIYIYLVTDSEDESEDDSEWRDHASNTKCKNYHFFVGGFNKYQKGQIAFFPDSGCFKCLLPTILCPKGAEGACKGGDIMHYFMQVCLQGSLETKYISESTTEVWEKYGLFLLRREREKLREGLIKYDREVFGTEAMVVVILFFEFSKVVFGGKGLTL